jgi:hypothetical protein
MANGHPFFQFLEEAPMDESRLGIAANVKREFWWKLHVLLDQLNLENLQF